MMRKLKAERDPQEAQLAELAWRQVTYDQERFLPCALQLQRISLCGVNC